MQPMWCNVAVLTVSLLYYLYRTYQQIQAERRRILRERVAFMLWAMVDHDDLEELEPSPAYHELDKPVSVA